MRVSGCWGRGCLGVLGCLEGTGVQGYEGCWGGNISGHWGAVLCGVLGAWDCLGCWSLGALECREPGFVR